MLKRNPELSLYSVFIECKLVNIEMENSSKSYPQF